MLNLQNIELLVWLCQQIKNPSELLNRSPPILSPFVLLSLVQQLGHNLSRDTALKVEWLRDACLALPTNDPQIAQYCPDILRKLKSNLEDFVVKNPDNENVRNVKLISHILNSLLK